MLEKLITFLTDNGIEIPAGSNAESVIEILNAFLKADSSSEQEDQENNKPDETTSDAPMGVE